MFEISRESPIPAYYQIALDLRERIRRREWVNGDRITAEEELAKIYGVSRVTMRQAIAELVKEDLLERHRGRGTFVKNAPQLLTHNLSMPVHLASQLDHLGFNLVSTLVESDIFENPFPEVAEHLNLRNDQRVTYLRRLLSINHKSVAISQSWFPHDLCPDIAADGLIDDSLSKTLAVRYGYVPTRTTFWLDGIRATKEEGQLLGIEFESPLIRLSFVSYMQTDTPLEYSSTAWLADAIRFQFSIDPLPKGAAVNISIRD